MTTQATPSPAGRRPTSTSSRFLAWAIAGVGVVGGLALVLLVSVVMFGRIEGEELSPHDFQRRKFHYLEVPLVHLQMTPIERTLSAGPLESLLVSKSYLPTSRPSTSSPSTSSPSASRPSASRPSNPGDPQSAAGTTESPDVATDAPAQVQESDRWDLVQARRAEMVSAVGDARILCQYLDSQTKDGTQFWLAWTESHEPLARVVWPLVGKLAMQKMYIFIPEVLEGARDAEDAEPFEREIKTSLANRFHQLAIAQQQQQRHEVALDLIQDGLSYDPTHKGLLAARRTSQSAQQP